MLAQSFSMGGPALNPVGGKKECLLNDHKEGELIADRSDSEAVSQGWTGRTGRRHGGQEFTVHVCEHLCRPVRGKERWWKLKCWFCPAWHCSYYVLDSSRLERLFWGSGLPTFRLFKISGIAVWEYHLSVVPPSICRRVSGMHPLLVTCMARGFPLSFVVADPSLMYYDMHVCCSPGGISRSSSVRYSAKKKGGGGSQ